MPRRSKANFPEVWINPNSNFVPHGHQAWDRRSSDIPNVRYLELADVALRTNGNAVKNQPDQQPADEE
jgi:hypothetical protein